MSSIITKAAAGLGAAVLALGLGATTAFAAAPSATPAAATPAVAAVTPAAVSGGIAAADASGHWQYVATLGSARSCLNFQIYYASIGVETRCDPGNGGFKFFIWVAD